MTHARVFIAAVALAALSCSDDGSTPGPDAPRLDQGPGPDKSVADGPVADQPGQQEAGLPDQGADTLTTTTEQEPNNGSSATEYNDIQIPIQLTGAIGTASDIDLFGIAAQAGQRFTVTVVSDGTLQPHLVVFDPAQNLPTAANPGPGATVMAEYYPLQSATILVGVRDRRNVEQPPQGVGGAAFTYTLTVTALSRAPVAINVGGQQNGTLDPPGTVRVFSFTATQGDDLDIAVVTGGSAVDARLSLFHPGQQAWMGTNENPASQDALLQGPMPYSGAVHAIVENVADSFGSNLGFTLKITKK